MGGIIVGKYSPKQRSVYGAYYNLETLMTLAPERQRMLELIRRNIQHHGRHIYAVTGGDTPRFLYTIGLYETSGFELLFAGGAIFDKRSIASVLNQAARLIEDGAEPAHLRLKSEKLGPVRCVKTDQSWVSRLLLGALDYYDIPSIPVWQIIPEEAEKVSIDIPDTAEPFSEAMHPVWRWLDKDCPHDVPRDSVAIADLDMLLGYAASEVMRWDIAEWEIYSGEKPESQASTYRVPLAVLLAFDPSLLPAVDLPVGRGLLREFNKRGVAGPWEPWGAS